MKTIPEELHSPHCGGHKQRFGVGAVLGLEVHNQAGSLAVPDPVRPAKAT